MEKRKPQYSLVLIKALISGGEYRVTRSALSTAFDDFGMTDAPVLATEVLNLESSDFYKSMTTLHDATLWQDVYHHEIHGIRAYIKVQILDDKTVIISFKRLEGN